LTATVTLRSQYQPNYAFFRVRGLYLPHITNLRS